MTWKWYFLKNPLWSLLGYFILGGSCAHLYTISPYCFGGKKSLIKEKNQDKNMVQGQGASDIHARVFPSGQHADFCSSWNTGDFEKGPRSDWAGEKGCVVRSSPEAAARMRTPDPMSSLLSPPLPEQRQHWSSWVWIPVLPTGKVTELIFASMSLSIW